MQEIISSHFTSFMYWSLMITPFRLCISINGLNFVKGSSLFLCNCVSCCHFKGHTIHVVIIHCFSFSVHLDFFADTTESRISLWCLELLCLRCDSRLNKNTTITNKISSPREWWCILAYCTKHISISKFKARKTFEPFSLATLSAMMITDPKTFQASDSQSSLLFFKAAKQRCLDLSYEVVDEHVNLSQIIFI